jgi:hypothetical protein
MPLERGILNVYDYRSMACELNILLKVCGDREKGRCPQDRSSLYLLFLKDG